MDEKLVKAIEILMARITPTIKADEAIKYTQAALNLTNIMVTLQSEARIASRKKASAS